MKSSAVKKTEPRSKLPRRDWSYTKISYDVTNVTTSIVRKTNRLNDSGRNHKSADLGKDQKPQPVNKTIKDEYNDCKDLVPAVIHKLKGK